MGAALFAAALLTFAVASTAFAADQAYVKTFEGETDVSVFSAEGTGNGELTHPRRSAVERSTGNFLVADRDNQRVQVFAPTANAAAYLTQFGAGILDEPFGIAIDQGTGDVFVSDPGKGEIFKFDSDGAGTPTYTLDASFTSPAPGSGAGQLGDFEADLAIDPSNGDLLVVDPGNNRVDRFDAGGAFVSSFDGADSPDGAFTGLLDLDVAPNGDVYVVDSTGPVYVADGEVGEQGLCARNAYCDSAPSRVLRFDSAGAYQSTVEPLQVKAAGLVAVDPDSSQVIVGRINPQNTKMWSYRPGGTDLIETVIPPNAFTFLPSLAVGDGRLYAVNDWEPGGLEHLAKVAVQVFTAVPLPEVTIDPIGAVTAETIQLSGSVDPQGNSTDWRFEYRVQGGALWSNGPSGHAGDDTGPVPVSGEIAGLEPNLTYEARLVAIGAESARTKDKTSASAIVTFDTAKSLAFASTRYAAPRTASTARINGFINPRNDVTSYYFEWGETSSYGRSAPVSMDGNAGSGGAQVIVAEQLTGLQPGTRYHYRLVAVSSSGKAVGEDRSFTTRTPAEMALRQRGIELVTPPDKGNQNPYGLLTPDGNGVVWSTFTGGPGATVGQNAVSVATRTSTSWHSRSLVPPAASLIGNGLLPYGLTAANADYSSTVFQVGLAANDGGSDKPSTFVRIRGGAQTILGQLDSSITVYFPGVMEAADTEHLFVPTTERLDLPRDSQGKHVLAPSGQYQLYDIGTTPPTMISTFGGEPVPCGIHGSNDSTEFGGDHTRWTSIDGSRVYFMSGRKCGAPSDIYMHDSRGTPGLTDDTTVKLTGAPVSGPKTQAVFLRASADGSTAIFYTATRLDVADGNEGNDIYRWRVGGDPECLTCSVPDAQVMASHEHNHQIMVSNDLSHVYFTSQAQLEPGLGRAGAINLYVWREQGVGYIATTGSTLSSSLGANPPSETNPDGTVLIFTSDAANVTADDNGGNPQFYRYSDLDGSVECVSCSPSPYASVEPNKPADPGLAFGFTPAQADTNWLSEDGSYFVFATRARLTRLDVNQGSDIYQWHNGVISLVTDGVHDLGEPGAPAPLTVLGLSGDGVNLLFKTGLALTGYEEDRAGNLYMARLDGGFGPPPVPPAPCAEDACQGPLAEPPTFVDPGSVTGSGPGNEKAAPAARKRKPHKCGARKVKRCNGKRRKKHARHGKKGSAKTQKHGTRGNG